MQFSNEVVDFKQVCYGPKPIHIITQPLQSLPQCLTGNKLKTAMLKLLLIKFDRCDGCMCAYEGIGNSTVMLQMVRIKHHCDA